MPEPTKPQSLREKIAALKRKVGEETGSVKSKEEMQRAKAANIKRQKQERKEMAKAADEEEKRPKAGWEVVAQKLKTVIEWELQGITVSKEQLREDIHYAEWLVKVGTDGKFVARILRGTSLSNKVRAVLHLDQEREFAFQSAAGRYGVGFVSPHFVPPIVMHRSLPEAVPLSSLESDVPLRQTALFIRRLHKMEHTGLTRFFKANVFIEIQDMIAEIKNNSDLSKRVSELEGVDFEKMTEVIGQFAEILGNNHVDDLSKEYVCHNFLLGSHFHKVPQPGGASPSLYLTNFQFASLGDRYYDLACCSYLNDFSDDTDTVFLKLYFEEEGLVKPRQTACFRLLKRVSMFWSALHSLLVGDVSKSETQLRAFQQVVDDSDFARYIGEELIS
eukprot:TRINITY_DN14366_c0_g1_i1.p1 TRINITY_DN14366_c0_g1~~TRINITY_DN14366_c0_g1_i1.p1  ORF type:complete len:407 (+),score=81.41 TRINITY_DN14366_c0_g1_i1:56-1222(+)